MRGHLGPQVRPHALVVGVGLDAQVAEAHRDAQVVALVPVGLRLLPGPVADHGGVAEAVVAVGEALEADPNVRRGSEAAEVGEGLLDRAVLPEVLGDLDRRRADDSEVDVPARHDALRLQVGALYEHSHLAVAGERLAVGLEAEAGRVLDGEIVVELEVDPPELGAVQVLGDGLRAIHVDLPRVRAGGAVDMVGVADDVVIRVAEHEAADPPARKVRRGGRRRRRLDDGCLGGWRACGVGGGAGLRQGRRGGGREQRGERHRPFETIEPQRLLLPGNRPRDLPASRDAASMG